MTIEEAAEIGGQVLEGAIAVEKLHTRHAIDVLNSSCAAGTCGHDLGDHFIDIVFVCWHCAELAGHDRGPMPPPGMVLWPCETIEALRSGGEPQ